MIVEVGVSGDNTLVAGWVIRFLLVATGVAAGVPVSSVAQPPTVNPQAAALKDFADRTRDYMAFHERLLATLPPIGRDASAEALIAHKDALASALRRERANAHEGDIFTRAVAPQFRAVIRRDLKTRDFKDVIATLADVPHRLVQVNMSWPAEAPRPTIPPRLLTSLYPLPAGLEYRFLDRHLVLLDVDAEIVVDLVRNVIPSSMFRRP